MVSHDCCVALSHGAIALSAVCDCGIYLSFSLNIFVISIWLGEILFLAGSFTRTALLC